MFVNICGMLEQRKGATCTNYSWTWVDVTFIDKELINLWKGDFSPEQRRTQGWG